LPSATTGVPVPIGAPTQGRMLLRRLSRRVGSGRTSGSSKRARFASRCSERGSNGSTGSTQPLAAETSWRMSYLRVRITSGPAFTSAGRLLPQPRPERLRKARSGRSSPPSGRSTTPTHRCADALLRGRSALEAGSACASERLGRS
jgi:hypothetical protein